MVQGWTSGKESKYIWSFQVSYGTERKSLRLYEDFPGTAKVGGKECDPSVNNKKWKIFTFLFIVWHIYIFLFLYSNVWKYQQRKLYKIQKVSIFFLFGGLKWQNYNFTFVIVTKICPFLQENNLFYVRA